MMGPRKVLIIAYVFPPVGGSGVQRTLKFVKYLPQFGWQPFVVSGDNGQIFGDGMDPSLLAEIPPSTPVWRRRFVSPLVLRRWFQKLLGVIPLDEQILKSSHVSSLQPPKKSFEMGQRVSPARRLAQVLAAPLAPFEFPPVDAALYWALSILPLCYRIIKQEKIDLIFTTSFPYSDHIAGYLLKRLTGKPWVADFRDPWTQNAFASNQGWRRRCDEYVERRILQCADRVIGVTPTYTQGLRSLVPDRDVNDFLTIENGFDLADFEKLTPDSSDNGKNRKVTMAHVGRVYDGSAIPFLQALKLLDPNEITTVRVLFVGGIAQKEEQWLVNEGMNLPIKISTRISHDHAVQIMRKSTALLLFIGDGPAWLGHYPGKLFEYLASRTPILMIGPDGEAARLVRESGAGCFLHVQDQGAIVRVLQLLVSEPQQFQSFYYHPRPEIISRFERKALAHRLALIFDELVLG